MTEIDSTISKQSSERPYDYAGGFEESRTWIWQEDSVILALAGVVALCAAGLLLLLAIALLVVVQNVLGINLPGINSIVQWLADGSKGLILAIVLAVAGSVSFVSLRYRLLHNVKLYSKTGCPQCKEQELIRVRRRWSDRYIARFGIPVRRYVCRNCSWGGLRIGGPSSGSDLAINKEAIEEIQ